jgi:hypothetical protein
MLATRLELILRLRIFLTHNIFELHLSDTRLIFFRTSEFPSSDPGPRIVPPNALSRYPEAPGQLDRESVNRTGRSVSAQPVKKRLASSPARSAGKEIALKKGKRRIPMSGARIAAIVLIVAGILGLAYGSFTYTKESHNAKLGPLEFSIKDKETVNVPVWAGVGAIVAGVVLLVARKKAS